MQTAAGLLLFFVLLFSVLELLRWRRPDFANVLTNDQKGRRLVGIGLLVMISIMIYAGTYWPPPVLLPPFFKQLEILYWLFVSLLTVFLPLIAFFEWKDSLKRTAELRRETYRSVITSSLNPEPGTDKPNGVHDTER